MSMDNVMNQSTQSNETNKTVKYSVASLIKKIDKRTIRFDHPSQRCSDQWTNKMKGNLISDILQNNPIPSIVLAEQVVGNLSIIWDLDGKQRCTNVYEYVKDGFKISKNVRRRIIKYQATLVDENGNVMVDERGVPIVEAREFDIVNKTYSQLPEELRDRIMDYCFDAVLYLNCSSDDIVYHIARYNDGRPMNKTQKGIINLGEDYAIEVKELSNHPFFVDFGDFGKNGKTNGNIDRSICETVMTSFHIDNWSGNNLESMCAYLKDNATIEEFEDVQDTLDRLEEIIDGNNESLFTTKEAFIWFTVFHRFKKCKIDDSRFYDFATEFVNSKLADKKINNVSYNDLEGNKSTKDKNLVIKKINHLERLMNEYFNNNLDTAA